MAAKESQWSKEGINALIAMQEPLTGFFGKHGAEDPEASASQTITNVFEAGLKQPLEKPRSFAYATARNLSRDEARKAATKRKNLGVNVGDPMVWESTGIEANLPAGCIDTSSKLEEQAVGKITAEDIVRILQLTEDQEIALRLELEGYSDEEVGGFLDITTRAAKGLIARVRQKGRGSKDRLRALGLI